MYRKVVLFAFLFMAGTMVKADSKAASARTAEFDSYFSFLKKIGASIPAKELSVSGCAFALEDNWEAAWQFVRYRIRYIPYNHIVKGAEGVLLTGEGSSLGKALLLAEILKDKGYAVKICQGRLSDEKELSLEKPLPPLSDKNDSLAGDLGLPDEAISKLSEKRRKEAEGVLDLFRSRTQSRFDLLKDFIKPFAPHKTIERYHYWVRVAASLEKWIDLDPTLGEKPGLSFCDPEESFDLDKIPDDLFASVKVTIALHSGKTKTKIITFSERLSDCGLKPIQLAFVPKSFSVKDKIEDTWKSFTGADRFIPVFNIDGKVILGNSFDLDGKVYKGSGDGRIDAAKRLGSSLGGLFGSGGAGKKKATPWKIELSGEIDYAPGEKRFHRTLLTHKPGQPPYGLLSTFSFLMIPGPVRDNFFTSKNITYLLDNEPFIRAFNTAGAKEILSQFEPYPTALYGFARSLRSVCTTFLPGENTAFPYLFLGYEKRVLSGKGKEVVVNEGYDIISSPLLCNKDDSLIHFRWGIALTELERLLVELSTDKEVLSPSYLLFLAEAQGINLKKIKKKKDLEIFPEKERKLFNNELSLGNPVIVTEKPVSWRGRMIFPYYVIDEGSGLCIGRIGGRGQAATEYAEMVDTVMSFVGAIDSYSKMMMCIAGAVVAPLAGKSQAQSQKDFAKCIAGWAIGGLFGAAKLPFDIAPSAGSIAVDVAIGGIPGTPMGGFVGLLSGGITKDLFGK